MAKNKQDCNWPLPMFNFKVNLGGAWDVLLQELNSLDRIKHLIEFRFGNRPVFPAINIPGKGINYTVNLQTGLSK
ncbi:hypothetical protein [Pleomorphovibrio marinus]|uniref:hypothetical protein n=1 Tax=Pleomorphovibrio marinus TaxID=2164132 RepID=UPI0018E52D1E|nr:hypothetical protein [Pleomorphovibrio marinus]